MAGSLPLVPLELRSFGERAGQVDDVTRWHELVAQRSRQADAAARRILGLPSPRLMARDMRAAVDVADGNVLGNTVDLQRFAGIVAQEAAHRYRPGDGRAVLDVHVEGGGNQRRVFGGEGGAERKGTIRAGLVVDRLRQAVEAGLRSRRIPEEAVEYHVSTRGSRLTRSPFGQSESIEAAARLRQVVMWVTPALGSPWQVASPAPVRMTSGPHVATDRDGTQ